jgi:apolipoprotein N-acyltransferase
MSVAEAVSARRIAGEELAVAVGVIGLAGMAYCHISDVGMKFEEHVYYMAALFCGNIAASVALIPAVACSPRLRPRRRAAVWAAAGALGVLTIAGFVWSRTIGFPQMADHIGEWDALGLSSVAFEMAIVATSAWMLTARRNVTAQPAGRKEP